MSDGPEYIVKLMNPHPKQAAFVRSQAKRKMVRAGRRSGKTVGVATLAIEKFLRSKRVLYAAPTQEQVERFWVTVTRSLAEPIEAKVIYKNESRHLVEIPGTEWRIRAKTAWNADTLRGDYADELILDEYQLMNEDAWGLVGAPMLLDNDGNATFLYTPPAARSRSVSKAKDPQHANKLYEEASQDETGQWEVFHFTSLDNPHISKEALDKITGDMTAVAYRMEILAEEMKEAPGALWKRENWDYRGIPCYGIDGARVLKTPDLTRIVVGVDPSATSTGDEAGIVTAGLGTDHEGYTISDDSIQGSPRTWAREAVAAYHTHDADLIVAESNQGGEMVRETIATVDETVPVKLVHASRGKATRAEPIAARSEKGKIHHVGTFPYLEGEMCLWVPGDSSPNRMDAMVWAYTELFGGGQVFLGS